MGDGHNAHATRVSAAIVHLLVGSQNPVKRRAVQSAVTDYDVSVESVPVDSGVADQPWGRAETIDGAKQRAHNALATGEGTHGVGLEGGVRSFDDVDGLYLIMWAAVTDGDRTELGAGPQLRLPNGVAAPIRAGRELGPVLAEIVGRPRLKEQDGAAGVLSDGIITRSSALEHAVATPLGRFLGAWEQLPD